MLSIGLKLLKYLFLKAVLNFYIVFVVYQVYVCGTHAPIGVRYLFYEYSDSEQESDYQ